MSNLPPLPSTNLAWKTPTTCGELSIEPLFTADQMRAYATAALAAQAAELEALRAKVASLEAGIRDLVYASGAQVTGRIAELSGAPAREQR